MTVNAMIRNTISLTQINSGYKTNIIPEKASATINIRFNNTKLANPKIKTG